jgi:RNA polymerase sigma-70 factor (ECF subfamily)
VVDVFLAAVGRGDLAGLLAVLAPEVELRVRGPEKTAVVRGAREVAGRATMAARPRADARAHPALIDGAPGVLITAGGRAAGHDHGLHDRGPRYLRRSAR